jgi:DNA (cytosine-5)-methyltransferase 1
MAVENHFAAKTAYWSDVDKTACAVMGARFPHAEPIGDLTTLDLTMLHADIITAGYPCQPFSLAGARNGTNDERHLWPYIRNTVSVLRPRFLVLENVAGHLSLGAAAVVGDLASLGYDAKWALIRASDVGAPHQRKRWFCVATDTDGAGPSETGQEIRARHTADASIGSIPAYADSGDESRTDNMAARWEHHQRSITNSGAARWGEYQTAITRWECITGRMAPEPIIHGKLSAAFVEWMMGLVSGHVTDIASSRPKALACLGNGVVPQQGALALELLT